MSEKASAVGESIKSSVYRRLINIDFAVGLWIAFILFLLFINLSAIPLWQDEAESALNALTVKEQNIIPRGVIKDRFPMHEMSLYFPKKGDPVYDYYPSHYHVTEYVTFHGWLPIYFIKLGINIFGQDSFGPRFFSVIFFGLFLMSSYIFVRKKIHPIVALLFVVVLTLTPNILSYSIQARYYSYMLFFCTLTVYLFFCVNRKWSLSMCIALALSEACLYHTYITLYILLNLLFIFHLLLFDRQGFRRFFLVVAGAFLFAIPHIIFTKFPQLAISLPAVHAINIRSFKYFFELLNENLVLFVLFLLFMFTAAARSIRWRKNDFHLQFAIFMLLLGVIGFSFISYTITEVAFYPRIYLPMLPFLILGVLMLPFLFAISNAKRIVGSFVLFGIILATLLYSNSDRSNLSALFHGKFLPYNKDRCDSRWVMEVLDHIDGEKLSNPLILTSFENFVFSYYSNYDAEIIWPIKKEFIDSTKRNLYIVLEDENLLQDHCKTFLPLEYERVCNVPGQMKYHNRLTGCEATKLNSVTVYKCPGES